MTNEYYNTYYVVNRRYIFSGQDELSLFFNYRLNLHIVYWCSAPLIMVDYCDFYFAVSVDHVLIDIKNFTIISM